MIAQWNLLQLANAILPLLDGPKLLEESLSSFAKTYELLWNQMMSAKLGFLEVEQPLVGELLNILAAGEIDMTLFYRELASVQADRLEAENILSKTSYQKLTNEQIHSLEVWLKKYSDEIRNQNIDDQVRVDLMNRTNPLYVFRNYIAQLAIDDAEKGDYSMVDELLDVFRRPYQEQSGKARFAEKRPDWARTRVGCSMLSCSS